MAGRFFEAHEAWEQGWKELPPAWKAEVQAWIMICGVLIHSKEGKPEAAARLLARAIELMAEAAAFRQLEKVDPLTAHGVLKDLDQRMLRLLAAWNMKSPDARSRINALARIEPRF